MEGEFRSLKIKPMSPFQVYCILLEVDIGHKILATLLLEIMKQEFMLKGEVDRCLRPTTISPYNQSERGRLLIFQKILLVVMGILYLGYIPATLPPKYEIVELVAKYMEVGLKRSNPFLFSLLVKMLMV